MKILIIISSPQACEDQIIKTEKKKNFEIAKHYKNIKSVTLIHLLKWSDSKFKNIFIGSCSEIKLNLIPSLLLGVFNILLSTLSLPKWYIDYFFISFTRMKAFERQDVCYVQCCIPGNVCWINDWLYLGENAVLKLVFKKIFTEFLLWARHWRMQRWKENEQTSNLESRVWTESW